MWAQVKPIKQELGLLHQQQNGKECSSQVLNHRVFTEQPKELWDATSGDQ
jgi:hypothetical protein